MLDSLTHVGKCHERLNLSLSDGLHHSPGYDVTGEVVDDSEQVMPQSGNRQDRSILSPDLVGTKRLIASYSPGSRPQTGGHDPAESFEPAVATRRADPVTVLSQ